MFCGGGHLGLEKYSNAFFSETTNMIKAKLYLLRFLFRYEIQNGGYGRT
jgi:hypothetical protein